MSTLNISSLMWGIADDLLRDVYVPGKDRELERAMTDLLVNHTELFKQFSDNESFRRSLSEMIFSATCVARASAASGIGIRVG